jgi:hypothetical protein
MKVNVNAKPQTIYYRKRHDTQFIGSCLGSRGGLDGCGNSRRHRDSNTDFPALIESLYRLSYPAHTYSSLCCSVSVAVPTELSGPHIRQFMLQCLSRCVQHCLCPTELYTHWYSVNGVNFFVQTEIHWQIYYGLLQNL